MKDSIEEMLQRWEEEPTPQLSLQLAEEYRRQGQLEEGTTILEQALRLHPHHVAARVAYGRFLLEQGRTEESAEVLEAVVEEDPTHLVANKVLIGLYLQTGRLKEATDRLDLYKLLNVSDPEIAALEARLRPAGSVAASTPAPERVDGVFILPEPPALSDLFGLAAAGQAGCWPRRSRVSASQGPFGDLWWEVDPEEYLRALGAEGIFPVALDVGLEELGELPVPEPEDGRGQLEDEWATESIPAVEELQEVAGDSEVAPDVEVSPPAQEIGATATLARLYLDQGHVEDAVQAFEEVLSREPHHVEAQTGLAEAQRRLGELVALEPPAHEEADSELQDARERKMQVLREYLGRLRAATGRQ